MEVAGSDHNVSYLVYSVQNTVYGRAKVKKDRTKIKKETRREGSERNGNINSVRTQLLTL